MRGHKVILLGPPSYGRRWQAVRLFPDLPATLDARPMSGEEVRTWLNDLEAAAERFFAGEDA